MPTIFEYAVGYVESLASFEVLERPARAGGLTGLAIKLHDADGNPVIADNVRRLTTGSAKRLREAGYSLGLWSCPRREPLRSSREVSELYGELGLSFVVFETEAEYKTDGGGIDVRELLEPWRTMRPATLTAVATEGMAPDTFNHRAAIAARCHYLPETYYRLGRRYEAPIAFGHASRLGWPAARVHAAVSGVEGHVIEHAMLHAMNARTIGMRPGVAVWRADMLTPGQYQSLALGAYGYLFRGTPS